MSDQQIENFRKHLGGIGIILRKIADELSAIWFSLKYYDDKNFENK